ncbi:MAG TPA: response regulator [Chryseosolibacter sp.]
MRHSHILLAEDDADDRDLFIEALAALDPLIRISTVEDGEELLDHLKQSQKIPDCIFLDLNMPKKNGKECLSEIKRDDRTRHIPVIIYTTSLNARDIDETFEKGALRFIRKPNSFKELTSVLNKCIRSGIPFPGQRTDRANFILR